MADSKTIKQKREKKKIFFFVILFLLLLAGAFYSSRLETQSKKINFDLYVMSQCPYGTQAESLVKQIMPDFKNEVDFNIEYIATIKKDGQISSLHGPQEIEGDIYQLCVKKYYPEKFWDYIACQNKNYRDLKSSFEKCANEVGIRYTNIKTCAQSDEGKKLLVESAEKTEKLQVAASPTFYIAGERYNGPRTKIGLEKALCQKISNRAKICKNLPEDKKVTAYLIMDSRCQKPACQTQRLESQLKNLFSKIEFKKLDYNTKQGKEFYEKYKLTYLPAVLFSQEIKETDNYKQIAGYLKKDNDLLQLALASSFNPTKEICDNKKDDTGNGLIDCQDPDCKEDLLCRPVKKDTLDLFVMSMCPYGTRALNAMENVFKTLGKKINFNIHYIAEQSNDGSFRSLHGRPEVEEDIRELCAIKYYPQNYKYMDYIWCRNKDIKGDWKKCAENFPKIKTCFKDGGGKKLLAQNIKLANELNIGASPTWMVNNKYIFNGIDAKTIKDNFCQYNKLSGCDKEISSQNKPVPASGSCQ